METAVLDIPVWLIPAFFVVAVIYSSAGFGGGSSYLALLALAGFPMTVLPVTALACNIIAVIVGAGLFAGAGHLRWRLVLPFMAASVPAAYLGGRIPLSETVFFFLLGGSLLAAAGRLLVKPVVGRGSAGDVPSATLWCTGIPVGFALGLLSGMTGIGGGVFLAPVLYFLGWAEAKTVSASCGVFILVNSVAGLTGQIVKPGAEILPELAIPLMTAVACGSLMGAGFSAFRFSPLAVRRISAVLIAAIAVKILWGAAHA